MKTQLTDLKGRLKLLTAYIETAKKTGWDYGNTYEMALEESDYIKSTIINIQ